MNRKIISVILLLTLCISLVLPVCAEEHLVYDEANLLTNSEEAALNQKLAQISGQYNAQILVVTLASLNGGDVDLNLEYIYDENGFGYGENHDGVMLMLCMEEREWRILSNGYAGVAITEQEIEWIGDLMVSYLSDGDYVTAFDIYADECIYYLDGYLNGFPFDFGSTLIMCLIFGLIVGLIVAFVLKGQLKSVRQQNRANAYVTPGSMQVTVHRDLFLYRNVTRTKKANTNSSGSRSGASRSTGGGRF